MNKSKLFFALFSLMGPVTVTQVKAMPAPVTPANEQSIRAMIQKIESDAKELAQLPSLKAEATKLLTDIQQSKTPVLGAPGTNNVMRNKSFSDSLVSLETKFKHPKEIASQIQSTISEVAAQIAAHQNPATKLTLNVIFNAVKQKAESLKNPVSEIESLFAKIKEELQASSGKKDPRNGFKPNKPSKPEEHQNGAIVPEDFNPPVDDSTEAKSILAIIKQIWDKAQAAINIIKDNKLVNHQFPQVTEANVAEFAKAYNQQVGFVSALTALITGELKTQLTATTSNAVAHGLVKTAAENLYKFIGTLRSDLVAVPQAHKDLAKSKNNPLTDVPAEQPLEKLLGDNGTPPPGDVDQDLKNALEAFGTGNLKKMDDAALKAIQNKISGAVTELKTIDTAMAAEYTRIDTLAKTDKAAAKTAFDKFEKTYEKTIKTLNTFSTAIANALPKIEANKNIKKKFGPALQAVRAEANKFFADLKTAEIVKPGKTTKKGRKVTTEPSKFQALKDTLNTK